MAFRLTKQEDARKSELESELEQLVSDTVDGYEALQAKIAGLVEDFNAEFVEPLAEKMNEAYGFVEDIHSERQGEFDEKSERWQEGDRGQAAADWLQQWENGLQGLESPAPLEVPDMSFEIPAANDALCELPFEMSE